MDRNFQIAQLIAQKIKGEISSDGADELQRWIDEDPDHLAFFERVQANDHLLSKLDIYERFDKEAVRSKLEEELFSTKVVKMDTRKWLRYAASLLLPIIGIGTLYYYFNDQPADSLANIDEIIEPGVQKATLVLFDGELIDLTRKTAPKTISQGLSQISNKGESLAYAMKEKDSVSVKEINEPTSPLVFNELIIPRGGRYQVALADGSKVTLNADSKLRFPVAFTGTTREVYLEGEAYFEVAHGSKPFIVNAESVDIQVLGTSFNVSDYQNERNAFTTLIEGSIKLHSGSDQQLLVPGEQGVFSKERLSLTVEEVDTDLHTAWVRGITEFENEDLESVMRRLARWYNFDFEFKNEQARNYHFTARLKQNQPISAVLEMLALTTNVKFELKEKTIIIR